jgi:hypothetical protein
VFGLVLIAFTLASYVAIFNARSFVEADDLQQLRVGQFAQPD